MAGPSEGQPAVFPENEKRAAERDARHDAAARGRTGDPAAVQHYLTRRREEEVRRPAPAPGAATAPSPRPEPEFRPRLVGDAPFADVAGADISHRSRYGQLLPVRCDLDMHAAV